MEEGAVLSIEEIRHRRLRNIGWALFGVAERANGELISLPHHGSAGPLPHVDLLPGTRLVAGGDSDRPLLQAIQTLQIRVADTVFISDSDSLERANLSRNFNTFDHKTTTEPTPASPDITVFFLFLSKAKRDTLIGDLEERFGLILEREGRRTAIRWFWRQVFFTFLSLVFDGVKRLSGLEKLCRRIGS